MATLTEIRERLRGTPERVRVAMKVAKTSGLLWAFNAAGVRELVKTLIAPTQNPSRIYRVHAKNSPDKVALIWRDEALTFGELDQRIDRLAAALAARGVARGSSIALMMRNRIEYVQLGAAASRLGAAAVSV